MPSKTSLVDVLSRLDQYSTSHTKASTSFKSTIWNICKARRQKGGLGVGFSVSASDVREELRAHVILECDDEHILVDEDTKEKELPRDIPNDLFVLSFGIPKESGKSNDAIKSLHETGLRKRKGKKGDQSSPSKWTEQSHEDQLEDRLRKQDPIELFGALPPTELKLAQKNAKETLQSYIDAANSAVEILRIIGETELE
eukprot:scaffold10175_cov268-Chaetoceros_neogracile.AAC.2